MATGQEIAIQLLPAFAENVVARHAPRSYGHYAKLIGRDPAKGAIAIGPAMHAIGAICVVQQLPVAPLYWVKRESGDRRPVFASDPFESHHILDKGYFDTMLTVAREYRYTMVEFEKLQKSMEKAFLRPNPLPWSPHIFWRMVLTHKPKGEAHTYFEQAMSRYDKLLVDFKVERARGRK